MPASANLKSSEPNMSSSKRQSGPSDISEVLDDLCMRFLVNLPAAEYESFERLFFAIESAHWFYDDFYRENNPSLPRLPLKYFAARLFGHTSLLKQYRNEVDRLYAKFLSYKQEVPTCGAALLNSEMDKVLLVRGWGPTARWGFPKGKLAKGETELDAAIREVQEETGFDMTSFVTSETDLLDSLSSGRPCRIFIVTNVPEDTKFETQTRKEISDIQWVLVSSLPDSPKAAKLHNKQVELEARKPPKRGNKSGKLFSQNGVAAFSKRLKSWISRRNKEIVEGNCVAQPNGQIPLKPNGAMRHALSPERVERANEERQKNSLREPNSDVIRPENTTPLKQKPTTANAIHLSDSKGNVNRKSRKVTGMQESVRNVATFGTSGVASLNNSEREQLFRRYVLETDRIAAEKGLKDDFWPVPYVTSKDFTAEELREAEAARWSVSPARKLFSDNAALQRGLKRASAIENLRKSRSLKDTFVFDRGAITAAMNDTSLRKRETMGNAMESGTAK